MSNVQTGPEPRETDDEPGTIPHRPGLPPDELENPGDPGPNLIVPPDTEDPRSVETPSQPDAPPPGV